MNAPVPWLDERRAEAANRFAALGVPHRRIEDWKYSDLKTVLESTEGHFGPQDFSLAWPGFQDVPGPQIVFNDGSLVSESLGAARLWDGVEVHDLKNDGVREPEWVTRHFGTVMSSDRSAMASASLANMRSGVAIRLRAGATMSVPLHLTIRTAYRAQDEDHFRVLLVLEKGASLTLLEQHSAIGPQDTHGILSNIGIEVVIEPNAHLRHIRLVGRNAGAVRVEEGAISVGRDASYQAHFVDFGAKLSRVGLGVRLDGNNANASLSGISVLDGSAHADVTTHVVHAVAHTTSSQLFKNVAGGKGRAVYQGKVTVEQGADKSDSRQTAKALLMGIRAEADLKPELEIFADDVKCAHGAAVGDLDPNSLFYLRARGIPEAEARNMLVRAFLKEAVDEIADEAIRNTVWQAVEDALPKAMLP